MRLKFTLFVFLACLMVSVQVHAFTMNNIEYFVTDYEKMTVEVLFSYSTSGDITIPKTVKYSGKTYTVTSIGGAAFIGSEITSVSLPSSIVSIGSSAFLGCRLLTSINIPDGVVSIGNSAFYDCGITSIKIGNGVESIGAEAFSYCEELETVSFGENLKIIGDNAFSWTRLTSITIPKSVISIGTFVFVKTPLISLSVEEGNTVYDSRNNCNAIIETASNKLICGIANSKIPDDIEAIGDYAFYNSGIESIRIPKRVKEIGTGAFAFNGEVTSIVVEEGNTVYDSRNNCNAIIETATNKLVVGCIKTNIPNNITGIGDYAFCSVESSNYNIPEGVTSIGSYAFALSSIRSITIPNSVKTIGRDAFEGCMIENVAIPNSVTSIGSQAFAGCYQLVSAVLPKDLEMIDEGLFAGCNQLVSITIPQKIKSIRSQAFSYCENLTSVELPQQLDSIGWAAFCGCENLKAIEIPASVVSIGNSAFSGSDLMSSLTLTSVTVNWMTPLDMKYIDSEGYESLSMPFGDDCSKITLYVPNGTKEVYETAPVWMNFGQIIEKEPSCINETMLKMEHARIFDLNGRQVNTDVHSLPRGIYIVNGKKVIINKQR